VSLSGPPLETVVLASSAIELIVLPAFGARLHRLRAFGHDLLRTPEDVEEHRRDPFYWGSYVMAPWGNRLAAGPVEIGRRVVDLTSNFRDGTAIHGQVYLRPWEQRSEREFAVRAGGDGWPWPYEARLLVEIEATTLRLGLSLLNLGDEPMPAGLGLHPWFRRPLELSIAAQRVYPDNLDAPSRPEPVAGEGDLRALGPVRDDLDATWAELGDPPVRLRWPAPGIAAILSATTTGTLHVVAASPAEVDAVAVEPATNAPQGLRRLLKGEPGGLAWLAPAETFRLDTTISFERAPTEGG
jgi:aldose 1-epimerase